MEKNMGTNIGHYFKQLTCTLFVVLGLLGIFAPASQAATGAFTFSAATYAVGEGAGNVNITINRVGGSTGAATVSWRTYKGTASSGPDFSGFGVTSLSFAAGETRKIMPIKIVDDTLVEPNETFKISLSSPTSGTRLGTITSAVVTILDNDTIAKDTTAPTVSITSPASTTITSAQTVTIAASASDNVGVSKVELYDGATLKGTDTTAPYSFSWAITSANNGNHSFTAKAYDAAGNVASSAAKTITVNIAAAAAPAVYTAPVLNPVTVSNGNYLLSWSLPATTYGVPSGGYDVFVDGVDDNLHHTTLSAVKSGLKQGVEHCFVVEARWTQATPSVFPASNKVCVPATQSADVTLPTVSLTSPATGTTYTSAQTMTITASAADNIGVSKVELYDGATLKGTDTTAPYSFSWAITSANNGNHSFTAKAYDAAGNVASSAAKAITVNIAAAAAPAVYTAPVLNPVTVSNGNYLLSWSLPATAYGVPSGGYDVFVDGVDDNLHHTTLSAVKSGLKQGVEHCFVVEARWTQSTPSVFPASNKVCVPATQSADVTLPTVSLTSPATGTTYTSAQTMTITASAADNVGVAKVELYDGATLKATDTTAPYSFAWAITSANNGSHSLTAKAYDAAGNSKVSAAAAVTVNIAVAAAVYEAPVLTYVQASGSDFLLGWSQPPSAYGAPAGGYDIFTDGIDGNNHTMQQTSVVSGLAAGEHCFEVEARWTQAVPAAYPLSNRLCAVSEGATQPPTTTTDLGPLKVFPGAKGFGTSSIAGRGGQIIKVTNLNDSGAGSLRAAVGATGPRVIVFEVSGRINLLTNLSVKNPFITIAGQTAPAPGVMVTGRTFIVTTHDVLVQHLSIRVGDEDKSDDSGRTADTIQITGTGAYNIVFDHVSASWAIDEIVGMGYGIKDITFSNCLIAEGLNNSVHPKGAHGYGFLLGDDSTRISLIGNLLAHAADRLPRVQGGDFLLVNNVIYNKGGGNFIAIGSNAGIATRMSAVGNLFLEGLDGVAGKAIAENSSTTAAGSAIYQKDNAYPGGSLFGGSHGVSSAPAASWISGLTYMTDPVNQVKTSVLKNAGARPAFRDAVDKRVVADTMNKTGRIIDSQRDVGGFPVLAQNKATFNAGTNPGGDDNRNGYTNLEEILYQKALQVEGR